MSHSRTYSSPRLNQSGIGLIEVLIALTVFLIVAAALMAGASSLFSGNQQSRLAIESAMDSHDFLSIVQGNSALLPKLNNLDLLTSTDPQIKAWRNAIANNTADNVADNVLLKSAKITTIPATCQPAQPCQITLTEVWRRPGGSDVTKTFVMQVRF